MFVDTKSKGPNQPQFCPDRQASSPNIPRVLGDLGLVQDNM